MGGWWRRQPRRQQVVVGALALVVAANVLLAGLQRLVGAAPGGTPGSSYATSADGLAAYADLLVAYGHPIRRLRAPLLDAAPDLGAGDVLVVIDADPAVFDAIYDLIGMVQRGGRLVVAGPGADAMARAVAGTELLLVEPGATSGEVVAADLGVAPGTPVDLAERGVWVGPGRARPLVDTAAGPVVVEATSGAGTVVAVADGSFVENGRLARAGNAGVALALAGPDDTTVTFAEAHHGYGGGEGLDAVPSRWKVATLGFAAAAAVFMWARGRRLGPAMPLHRELAPPRRAYVEAIAANLARTKHPEGAVAFVRSAARAALVRRLGLAPAVADDEVRRLSRNLGIDPADVEAVLGHGTDPATTLALGRALSTIERTAR